MTTFLLAVGIALVVAGACGWLTRRCGLTQTVGEIVAGLLLGPTILGHLWPQAERALFPSDVVSSIELVATLVVLVHVAQVGAAIDQRVFRVPARTLGAIVALALALALLSGVALRQSFPELVPSGVSSWAFLLFVSAALMVTAVPVLARLLDETGLTRSYAGGWALALAVCVDALAFTVAAIATSLSANDFTAKVVAGPIVLVAFVAVGTWLRPRVAAIKRGELRILLDLALLALALAAASAVDASTIVAAFVVGAFVWRAGRSEGEGTLVAAPVVRGLVPLYLVYSGLNVDLGAVFHADLLGTAAVVLGLAVVGKTLASVAAGRLLGLGREDRGLLAVLANTRGLTELVLLNLGHSAGVLSDDAYAVFFVMTIVTTAASGALARRYAERAQAATMRRLERELNDDGAPQGAVPR